MENNHLKKVDAQGNQVHSPKPKRSSSRPTDTVAPDSPPELPLIRISSFPDLVAAGLAASSMTPDTTPVSVSDSFTVSDSSSIHGLLGFASEFPQPPSLSPALRKMQSVPWLKDDHAGNHNNSSWRRMSGAVTTQEHGRDADSSFPYSMDDMASVPSANSSFYLDTLMALQQQAPAAVRLEDGLAAMTGDGPWSGQQHAYKTRTTDDLFEWSTSHRREDTQRGAQPPGNDPVDDSVAQSRQQSLMKRADGRRNTLSSTTPDIVVPLVAEKRRTVRKVASMQSSSEQPGKSFSEAKTATGQRTIPKIRSRLFPSHSYNSNSSGKQDKDDASVPGSRSQAEFGSKSRNWFFHLRNSSDKAAKDVNLRAAATGAGQLISAAAPSSRDDLDRRNFGHTLHHLHPIQRTPYPTQGGPPPTLASANDRRTSKIYRRSQYRDSEPQISGLGLTAAATTEFDLDFVAAAASKSSIGLGLDTYGASGHNALDQGTGRPLDGPFTLRKSQANEYARARSNSYRRSFEIQDTSIEGSTSFMDITPERKKGDSSKDGSGVAAVEKKDRVRKFIAKASSGFLEWSRGLASAKRT
ncbi:hypothetical protein MD484_g2393, partial [Candolleomyces efflorescens]